MYIQAKTIYLHSYKNFRNYLKKKYQNKNIIYCMFVATRYLCSKQKHPPGNCKIINSIIHVFDEILHVYIFFSVFSITVSDLNFIFKVNTPHFWRGIGKKPNSFTTLVYTRIKCTTSSSVQQIYATIKSIQPPVYQYILIMMSLQLYCLNTANSFVSS